MACETFFIVLFSGARCCDIWLISVSMEHLTSHAECYAWCSSESQFFSLVSFCFLWKSVLFFTLYLQRSVWFPLFLSIFFTCVTFRTLCQAHFDLKITKENGHISINHVANVIYFMASMRIIIFLNPHIFAWCKNKICFWDFFSLLVILESLKTVSWPTISFAYGWDFDDCIWIVFLLPGHVFNTWNEWIWSLCHYLKIERSCKETKEKQNRNKILYTQFVCHFFLRFIARCVSIYFFRRFIYIPQHVHDTPCTYIYDELLFFRQLVDRLTTKCITFFLRTCHWLQWQSVYFPRKSWLQIMNHVVQAIEKEGNRWDYGLVFWDKGCEHALIYQFYYGHWTYNKKQ